MQAELLNDRNGRDSLAAAAAVRLLQEGGHAHPSSSRLHTAPATTSRKRILSPSRRHTAAERGTSHPAASRTWWCSPFDVPIVKALDPLITSTKCRPKRAIITNVFFTVAGGEASDTRLTRTTATTAATVTLFSSGMGFALLRSSAEKKMHPWRAAARNWKGDGSATAA